MQIRRWRRYTSFLLVGILAVVCCSPSTASAITSSSTNYKVTETEFNASSSQESCSAAYCAKVSIGDISVGNAQANAYKAAFGPVTPEEPLLEVIVDPGISDLGKLTSETTGTKTMVVRVRSYLSDGYTLQITGKAPTYDGRTLRTLTTPSTSTPGTEQFGLNIVANTSPAIGANPVQTPSDQISFGVVNDDYKLVNQFKFLSGDAVAHSNTESGQTEYTISMIVNISNATPAGNYSTDFSAVVIPVY